MSLVHYLVDPSVTFLFAVSRNVTHHASPSHSMVHSSSWSPPVGQLIARNWDERMDLHSSTQTSVHIYKGLEDDKKINNCIAEQTW